MQKLAINIVIIIINSYVAIAITYCIYVLLHDLQQSTAIANQLYLASIYS